MKKSKESKPIRGAEINEEDLLSFVKRSMLVYGQEVNLERAVPDFRDGFKPVQRRIAWSTHLLRTRQLKAARIVGDCMGKFHPHGDASIYGALVNMVTATVNQMDGVGNWGTISDQAAAMRYPTAGLSNFGKTFFNRHFTPIIDYVPNFDRSEREPLVLPSLLPNLLFNGTSGIGVGLNTDIPSFSPGSVLKLMLRMLDGEKLSASDFAKDLVFTFPYGGVVTKTKKNRKAILNFMENRKGTVEWHSPLEIDTKKKEVTLFKFAPEVDPKVLAEGKKDKKGNVKKKGLKDWDNVSRVTSSKGVSIAVRAHKDLNANEFTELAEKIAVATTRKISYEIYVTERIAAPELGEGRYKVEFFSCSIPELFAKWLKWRVKLEVRSLDWQIQKQQEVIEYVKLMIYASDNLETVFKALKSKESAEYLQKHLKITLVQANQILDLQVRRLSALDRTKLDEQLKKEKAKMEDLKKKRKDPAGQVRIFLAAASQAFEEHSQFAGTDQYRMKTLQLKDEEEAEEALAEE